MRSINLGIRVKEETLVSLVLPFVDEDAVAQVARGNNTQFQRLATNDHRRFEILLTPGDYVFLVDSTTRPAADAPFELTTSADVAFWSAIHPAPATHPRPWAAGMGRRIVATDPKDPWPQPPAVNVVPCEGLLNEFLNSSSQITDTMRQLLDANAGKGASGAALASATIHALLIGIDEYRYGEGKNGAIYRDLHGCVRDILEVEKLLHSLIPEDQLRITRLIAPRGDRPGKKLEVPRDCVPTYDNIVAKWKTVIETAQPNDIVYIHYSGHGGRARTRFPDEKSSGWDEALAPCDINDRERGRYLRDVEIAALLQQMARRELLTTVVLDSCHSGSATRGDAQARAGECDDRDPRGSDALPSAVASANELITVARQLANSPSGPAGVWRINDGRSTSYHTVITACGQHEAAYECTLDGSRYGVLTYFWRKALRKPDDHTTYRRIYDQMFGDIGNLRLGQTPLLLGEQDRLVLGTGVKAQRATIPVRAVDGDEVTLGAGAAMQVEVGMHLAIVPPDRYPELVELSHMAEVEVTAVLDGATSLAQLVPGTGHGSAAGAAPQVCVGAQAIVRSFPLQMQRTVRLAPDAARADALAVLAATITRDPRKLLAVTESGSNFQVFVRDGQYRICGPNDATLPYVPPIAVADRDAASKMVDLLVHIARYDNTLQLANSDSAPLAGKLDVDILEIPGYAPGRPLQPRPLSDPRRIHHGSHFCLRVHNRSSHFLQIAIIDLQPNWAIDTLIPEAAELAPGETREFALRASLPDPAAPDGREVLKVLATRNPVNPALLKLPPLGMTYMPKQPRGHGETPLDELFRILQEPLVATRMVAFASAPSNGWVVAQRAFEIHRRLPAGTQEVA